MMCKENPWHSSVPRIRKTIEQGPNGGVKSTIKALAGSNRMWIVRTENSFRKICRYLRHGITTLVGQKLVRKAKTTKYSTKGLSYINSGVLF